MMSVKGWLLDAYIEGSRAVLWLKTESGEAVSLRDRYRSSFYLKPRKEAEPESLQRILESHPNISDVRLERKYLDLHMKRKAEVLKVEVNHPSALSRVISDVKKLHMAEKFFNTDLLHIQQYLFGMDLPPTCRLKAEYDSNLQLNRIKILDDDLEIKPPSFTKLLFKAEVEDAFSKRQEKRIKRIIILEGSSPIIFDGGEDSILESFQKHVIEKDPDFLIAENVEEQLSLMRSRAISHGYALQLGRATARGSIHVKGRVCMDLKRFLAYGIEGVCERSRWTIVPPRLSCRWPAGKTIDSRQCYEALKRGVIIPDEGGFHIYHASALETAIKDRGGLVIAPKAGLHENVAELDFESMFPSIMVKHNISYETVSPDGIDSSHKGLLPALIETILYRRLRLKHLRNKFPEGSQEWLWCENRQKALKEILVCIYGYSGCFANRFGNVRCYEETNRLARETLLKAINIALDRGFSVIYGDSDSLFVKKPEASREDYAELADTLSSATGLPITLNRHYKFIVFLKQKAKPHAEAARRYYGRLMTGRIHCRGIDLRRGDTPPYIREFQEKLIKILLDAESTEEILKRRIQIAINYVSDARSKILRGTVPPSKLAIRRTLRRNPSKYRSRQPHVIAAEQLELAGGKSVDKGTIEFLYVSAKHRNPYRRVAPIANELKHYDREKYAELLLKAAETILGPIQEMLSLNGSLNQGLVKFF